MYLPQFHEIPENSKWWGEGFTEWTNVKKATSFFKGHVQPQVPMNKNYYDLQDGSVMKWQAKLANEFSVDAFSFYHYWFKDGKRVLEKPAENLLQHTEIPIEYCFTWANEDWTKTWHGAGGEKEVLLKEEYGSKRDWKEHFEYLLPFFEDKRYLKTDNKPLFMIHGLEHLLRNAKEMLGYWNYLAKKAGFSGIYFVAMNSKRTERERKLIKANRNVLASVDFVPGRIREEIRNSKDWRRMIKRIFNERFPNINFFNKYLCTTIDYDDFNKILLKYEHRQNEWRNCLVNYDDSPRRGKKGLITVNCTPEKFSKYLEKMMRLSKKAGDEYIFITAWNEWGESNHLEPDEVYGYRWLEAVKRACDRVNPKET